MYGEISVAQEEIRMRLGRKKFIRFKGCTEGGYHMPCRVLGKASVWSGGEVRSEKKAWAMAFTAVSVEKVRQRFLAQRSFSEAPEISRLLCSLPCKIQF